LDELLADYLIITGTAGKLPSQLAVTELFEWSHAQTQNPVRLEDSDLAHRDSEDIPLDALAALDTDAQEIMIAEGLVYEAEAFGASPEFARAMVQAGYRAKQNTSDRLSCELCALGSDCVNLRDQQGLPVEGCGSHTLYWVRVEEVPNADQEATT
jgi:hypothetical protein